VKPPDASRVVAEFTHQAAAFAASPAMRAPAALDDFLALVPAGPGQRWCDVACGPGIVARALAGRVAEVVGVDLTPAMLEKARSDAVQAGLANVSFVPGDATALPLSDGTFDGALTRFSLHHIPVPARVIAEMARIVRPGGLVAVADQLTSADGAVAAWHQEIERLRDPSHWASLTWSALGAVGDRLGMTRVAERATVFELDWEEWLGRGSGGPANRALIERLLATPPAGAGEVFSVGDGRLRLRLGMVVWRRER
jgi:SAM-dependent methyltransferase